MQRKIIMSSALTAASMFAGDSSFGLESIEMMLRTILSTCMLQKHNKLEKATELWIIACRKKRGPTKLHLNALTLTRTSPTHTQHTQAQRHSVTHHTMQG